MSDRASRTSDPVRAAELWRAVGLGFSVVWAVVLALVVMLWVRVVFLPKPGEDVSRWTEVLLAPVALSAAVLLGWVLVGALRILARRASGWDAVVTCGAFAVAVAVFLWAPARLVDALTPGPFGYVVTLLVLGTASLATGLLAQRAFRSAAVDLEPSRDRSDDSGAFAGSDHDGFG